MEPIPEDVLKFLYDQVESIDQLEILRVLGEDRQKEWSTAALAHEVQTSLQAVRAHVAAMQGRGLIATIGQQADVQCRHGAATPEIERKLTRLLQIYKERPVTMIKMVYERANDPLRAFVDAFRLRKES